MTTNELAGATLGVRPPSANPEKPVRTRARGELVLWISTFLTVLGLLVAWEVAIRFFKTPSYLFPAPSSIFERLITQAPFFATNALTTLVEALAGFALGSAFALLLAILIVHFELAQRVLYPIALLVKVTPIVAVAPLLVIWLGFGPAPKVVIAALITFFPVLVNGITGFRSVNAGAFEFLRSVAASPLEIFFKLRLPGSLPYLFAAARVSIPLSLIGAVVAEWWGASDGLGRIIFLANSNLDMPTMFGAVAILASLGVLLSGAVGLFERLALSWHESSRLGKLDGSMSELRLVGLRTIPEVKGGDDVGELLVAAATSEGVGLMNGDVVVVTQKIVSKAERRLVNVVDITPSEFAETLGKQWDKDPRKIEVVLRESRRIVRMDRGILITETHHGFVCANSGVDELNVAGEGVLALLPVDPDKSAREIRETIRQKTGATVAVIISDTFGRPWRAGLTDIAIGVSGIEPITDFRGQYDKFGYELRVSVVAIADELAGAAELAGGKTANVPVVVIRGFEFTPAEGSAKSLVREAAGDMFR